MRRILASFFALLGLCVLARAQGEYPRRPITLVVPYAAGGPSDVIARVIGQSMTATLGQAQEAPRARYGSPTPARMATRYSFTISRLPQHTLYMATSATRHSRHSSSSASSTTARSC